MNPKWALSTIPEKDKKVKSADLVDAIQKSQKQLEQSELYYALQANKKNNLKF
jgi:hypothetical protein